MTEPDTMRHALERTDDPAWVLNVYGYDPLRESSIESRFAISNGFLGIRGARAASRGARWVVPARTYVAGLFDVSCTEHATPGLVPAADWLRVRFLVAGEPLLLHPNDVSSHRMTLDLRRGALLSQGSRLKAPELSLHAHTLRLVSLSDRAIGLQLIQLEVESGALDVTIEASFEGVGLGLIADRLEQDLGLWHTSQSGKRLAMASEPSLQIDGRVQPPAALGKLTWSWNWKCHPGQVVCFQRFVAVVRSDLPDMDPGPEARDRLQSALHLGWSGVLAEHESAWTRRWHASGIEVDGDAAAQRALRFAIYHLNSAANPADESVSIGARALTGDDYHGHVFWDTEIFLLPFYVLTWPEAARALLMYRFHTLPAARAKAASMGWRGALYAWESATTGAEMTPEEVLGPDRQVIRILCGTQEQHISADIAYAVWQYWYSTGDDGFLIEAGAEILFETARFWSSRARQEADGRSHIRGVIGPDEYHEHIDDNAYTNVMARWNIRRALDVAAALRERWPACWTTLAGRLLLDDAELNQWRMVAHTLTTGLDRTTGLFEQFAGYFDLEDIDLAKYAGRTVPMDVVVGRERTQQSQVVPPRCSNGSSLSPAMHGLVAARLGDTEMALRFFRETADIDLADSRVATDGGIHIAALGGIWMLTVLGFAGLSLRDEGVDIEPHLPANWHSLTFRVHWRGRCLKISIDQDKRIAESTLEAGEPMIFSVRGERHELRPLTALQVPIGRP